VYSLATWSRQLALSFGCAGKGLSGVGRHCFYLALPDRLSCLCSRLLNHPVRQENCRVIPVDFDVRSGRATPIICHSPAGPKQRLSTKKWGWATKNWPSKHRPGRSRKGSGEAFKVTVERLGGGLAALVCHAREPANMVTGDGNHVLPKRMPRGRTP
jgi:hypothetical protein